MGYRIRCEICKRFARATFYVNSFEVDHARVQSSVSLPKRRSSVRVEFTPAEPGPAEPADVKVCPQPGFGRTRPEGAREALPGLSNRSVARLAARPRNARSDECLRNACGARHPVNRPKSQNETRARAASSEPDPAALSGPFQNSSPQGFLTYAENPTVFRDCGRTLISCYAGALEASESLIPALPNELRQAEHSS